MRYDFLREPISEDEPCGPDLEEAFDAIYAQWTAEASGLIPERFYTPRMGGGVTVFDRASIDYSEQERRLIELLRKSKDLRLLVLDARFQLLAGNLTGFSEALTGVEILATAFWEGFHPVPFDGTDYVMRVNTLEAFNDNALVIPAFHRVPLLTGRRTQITYRNFLVATGALTPYEGEEVMTRDFISRTLAPPKESPESEPTREKLISTRDTAVTCLATLGAIRQTFIDKAGHVNAPKFEVHYQDVKGVEQITGLEPILKAMIAFLNENLGEAEAAIEDEGTDGGDTAGAPVHRGSIANHGAAATALKAAEDYFLRTEPSSPALILVHQARLLIGRPLTEALETLMPEPATRATLRFESGHPFSIDLARMKLVTDNLLASAAAEAAPEADDGWSGSSDYSSDSSSSYSEEASESSSEGETSSDDAGSSEDTIEDAATPSLSAPVGTTVELKSTTAFTAATRTEASQLLSSVESFFRQVEPSSPIPTLLIRARSYFGKDFSAILNEMMPPDPVASTE